MNRPLLAAASLGTIFLSAVSAGAATLVGDTVERWSIPQLSGTPTLSDTFPVIDPGVEYQAIALNVLYDLDIAATAITLTSQTSWFSSWFNSGNPPTALELRDLDFVGEPLRQIVGVDLEWTGSITPEDNAPADYPAFGPANVSWTADSVRLTTGPYRFEEGSTVTMTLITAAVPEPASGVVAIAALGLVSRRRRRSGA